MAQFQEENTNKAKSNFSKVNLNLGEIVKAYWQLPAAIIIVLVLFFGTRAVLEHYGIVMVWYWLNIWSLLVTIMVLAGANAAINSKNKVSSSAITWFLIALFTVVMLHDYNYAAPVNNRNNNVTKQKKLIRMTLEPGTYKFPLEVGEKTPWIRFSRTDTITYDISSVEALQDYVVRYDDGTTYYGGANIPSKEAPYLKIEALKKMTIKIVVKKPNG